MMEEVPNDASKVCLLDFLDSERSFFLSFGGSKAGMASILQQKAKRWNIDEGFCIGNMSNVSYYY
jgi:hypothetical protein